MEHNFSLYQLTAQQQAIEDALIDNGGELTEELATLMDENSEAIATKVDGCNALIRNFEGRETAIDAEIKRLTALKKAAQNAQKNIKAHLLYAMHEAGISRLDGKLCKVSIRTTPALDVDEDVLLATIADQIADWQRTLPSFVTLSAKVSKTAIKAAFPKDSGVLPAGCQYVDNESVTIR